MPGGLIVTCPACEGRGRLPWSGENVQCPTCRGYRFVDVTTCTACSGYGHAPGDRAQCPRCAGRGWTEAE